MPITIVQPVGGAPFGPGFLFNATSTFVPDPPGSAHWEVGVRNGESLWTTQIFLNETQPFRFSGRLFTRPLQSQSIIQTNTAQPTRGSNVGLQVELVTGGIVVESQLVTVTWDDTAGLGLQHFYDQPSVAAGSFTEQDRQLLVSTQGNTVVNFTQADLPLDMSAVPLSRLPWIAPIGGAQRVGPVDISGRGSLDLGSLDGGAIWMAMRWFFTVLPPGYGFTRGAIDEFERRVVQLVPVYSLGTTEEIGEPILDEHASGGFYLFPVQPGLSRVEYQVAPGVTVSLFLYKVVGS